MQYKNFQITVNGLHCDIAVDYGWELHYYPSKAEDKVPVEFYCFDHEEWDVSVEYVELKNGRAIDLDEVLPLLKKWVECMTD